MAVHELRKIGYLRDKKTTLYKLKIRSFCITRVKLGKWNYHTVSKGVAIVTTPVAVSAKGDYSWSPRIAKSGVRN